MADDRNQGVETLREQLRLANIECWMNEQEAEDWQRRAERWKEAARLYRHVGHAFRDNVRAIPQKASWRTWRLVMGRPKQ